MQAEKIIKQNIELLPIAPKDIDTYWSLCQFMIIEALQYNGRKTSAPQIKQEIIEGFLQLYIIFGSDDGVENKMFGVLITRITKHPNLLQLEVEILTGKKRELWEDKVIVTLEQLAVMNDCARISILARPGWKKLGDKNGYKVKNYEFVKQML